VNSFNKESSNGPRVLAWRIAGLLCLALAVVGVVLPLVPTTPLLLLAAFCFGRGSERMLRWLLEHPRFGPPIRDWRENRSISRRAKVCASLSMILVVAVSILLDIHQGILITQVVVLALVAAFILTRPESIK
jgi:uncharacterized membrane protein YbaN (DUF454 family)